MEYYTYWSILDTPSNSTSPTSICLILLILSLITLIAIIKFKESGFEKKLYIVLTTLFLTLSVPAYFYLKFFVKDDTEKRINKILSSTKVGKVEGVIKKFNRRIEYKRQATVTFESFEVDSMKFAYADYLLGKFNRFSETNNGVLQNGINVRITYRKGDYAIQKIEIEK
ncbi:hypothetical protein [Kaistella jeonii]|nr:hypothetical protein [Kaistella jeonii]SFB76335.1 hypothetical protein SAMN05421876_1021 [Kaistella jeonii]VEI96502.1 Uncharacterised protein [Kaistella jeonii]